VACCTARIPRSAARCGKSSLSCEPSSRMKSGSPDLRREQSPRRKNLKKVEQHHLPSGKQLLKVSPLADWMWAQVWEYTTVNRLSYRRLYDRGYFSIGCEPCTALTSDPNNARSGRWDGEKRECGIHTFPERSQ
jgi:phosphoadenosine phosphosulfate reductase